MFTRSDIATRHPAGPPHRHEAHSALSTGTVDYGFLLRCSASSELTVYTDADWVGCPDTCQSTSGYVVFLDANFVSLSSKHQNTVSCLCADAEYRIVANGVVEACWLW
jgi:hypothetical protein